MKSIKTAMENSQQLDLANFVDLQIPHTYVIHDPRVSNRVYSKFPQTSHPPRDYIVKSSYFPEYLKAIAFKGIISNGKHTSLGGIDISFNLNVQSITDVSSGTVIKVTRVIESSALISARVIYIQGVIMNPSHLEGFVRSYSKMQLQNVQKIPYDWKEHANSNNDIPKRREGVFRIMSYNVQEFKNYKFGMIPWTDKNTGKHKMQNYDPAKHDSHKEIMNVIFNMDPSAIGIQESSTHAISNEQHQRLIGNGYEGNLCNADPGWMGTLRNGIFAKGVKIISKHPVPVGVNGDPRCMSVITISVKGVIIVLATIHLSYKKQNQVRNIQVALEYLKSFNQKNVILMGDFNSLEGDQIYNYITVDYLDMALMNARMRNLNPQNVVGNSIYNYKRIDFIFTSKTWDFDKFPLLGTYTHYNFHSDHFPVIADFGGIL